MADEVFSPTSNFGQGHLVGGVSSAENGSKLVLRVNPTTKRLLVDATVGLGGLALPDYDYMALVISSETETYTFKTGGSGGTTVATVTIVYTDSSRSDISTVTKT